MTRVPVVIVGAGTMGAAHAEALASLPRAELVGIVSRDARGGGALAGRFRVPRYPALREAIRRARPRAVWIAAATPAHRALAEEAAAAGLDVFCEKPLARTARDAEAILRAGARARVKLTVGHVLRWFPDFALLHRLVRAGELGPVSVVRITRGAKFPTGRHGWFADPARSGGPLLDMAVHDFDWLRWTFGPARRVHAREVRTGGRAPSTYGLALVRMAAGPIAHVEAFWGHDLPFRMAAEVAGRDGLAETDSAHPVAVRLHRAAGGSRAPAVAVPESPLAVSPYAAEDDAFLDAILGAAPVAVSGGEALEALRLALAAIASARTGRSVTLA